MVIGNQHRPLITRQQRGVLHERAGPVDAFSVRVRPNTNAPA
jgi:hypothetical protein